MTWDENILTYEMNGKDEMLAKIAEIIIGAYNGSFKPPLIDTGVPVYVKHTPKGYSCISSDKGETVHTTDQSIEDFIGHVFLTLGGIKKLNIHDVAGSKAVKELLKNRFGMEVELSLADKGDPYKEYTMAAVWIKNDDPERQTELEEKGFCHLDRDIWGIQL